MGSGSNQPAATTLITLPVGPTASRPYVSVNITPNASSSSRARSSSSSASTSRPTAPLRRYPDFSDLVKKMSAESTPSLRLVHPWTPLIDNEAFSKSLCISPVDGTAYVFTGTNVIYRTDNLLGQGEMRLILYAGRYNVEFSRECADGHKTKEAAFYFHGGTGSVMNMNGVIYFCESARGTIRKIEEDMVSTISGLSCSEGVEDGIADWATFKRPTHLAFAETSQTLFIWDDDRIRSLRSGIVKTLVHLNKDTAGCMAFNVLHNTLIVSYQKLAHLMELDVTQEDPHLRFAGNAPPGVESMVVLQDGSLLVSTTEDKKLIHMSQTKNHRTIVKPNQGEKTLSSSSTTDLEQLEFTTAPFVMTGQDIQLSSPGSYHLAHCVATGQLFISRSHCNNGAMWEYRDIAHRISSRLDLRLLLEPSTIPPEACGDVQIQDSCAKDQDGNMLFFAHSEVLEAALLDPDVFAEMAFVQSWNGQSPQHLLRQLYTSPSEFREFVEPTVPGAIYLVNLIRHCHSTNVSAMMPLRALKYLVLPYLQKEELFTVFRHVLSFPSPTEAVAVIGECVSFAANDFWEHTKTNEKWRHLFEARPDAYSQTMSATYSNSSDWISLLPLHDGLYNLGYVFSESVQWTSTQNPEDVTKSPPSGFFRFTITGITTDYIDVPDLFLFASWNFVRRSVAANLLEARTRVIELPSDFPPLLLLAIIRAIHGRPLGNWTHAGNHAFKYALSEGQFLDLIDAEGVTIRPFEQLISIANQGNGTRRFDPPPSVVLSRAGQASLPSGVFDNDGWIDDFDGEFMAGSDDDEIDDEESNASMDCDDGDDEEEEEEASK